MSGARRKPVTKKATRTPPTVTKKSSRSLPATKAPFLSRVVLRNYRSIEACDVALAPVTVLVGQNGSGKSNFLDALRFTADALRHGLDNALEERGGIKEVRRRSSGHPTTFAVRLDLDLGARGKGHYSFEVTARSGGGFRVKHEECVVAGASFRVRGGQVERFTPGSVPPPAAEDRLFLTTASGFNPFRAVYDSLEKIAVYSLAPEAMRELQKPDAFTVLRRDGRNLASILRSVPEGAKDVIEEYLAAVVPGIKSVARRRVGPAETLEFEQESGGEHWKFYAANMSDGTLRALGVLTAVFQAGNVPLVGIEEPEVALHPAAAAVLRECLQAGGARRQVIVTSHSPDLLDDFSWTGDQIRAVQIVDGATTITPLDEATRAALRDHLYTPGEMLRVGQLAPDLSKVIPSSQLKLFGDEEE